VAVDDQAYERAAIWYVGAFGALGAVLLGGASLAGVDWSQAQHPVWALVLVAAAVIAAFTVVTLASRVITPGCTSSTLIKRTDRFQKRLQKRTGGAQVTWEEIASEDKGVLRALLLDEAGFDSSPDTLWAGAKTGNVADRQALTSMVTTANNWLAERRFRVLRFVTPVAALVVLVGGLTWKPLTAPQQSNFVTSADPAPVQVELAPHVNPETLIGPGCTLRGLAGVAIAGNLTSALTVAFAPQGDCPAAVININPASAIVERR
jgi:hypothetical protein